jgi:hypothetical protein
MADRKTINDQNLEAAKRLKQQLGDAGGHLVILAELAPEAGAADSTELPAELRQRLAAAEAAYDGAELERVPTALGELAGLAARCADQVRPDPTEGAAESRRVALLESADALGVCAVLAQTALAVPAPAPASAVPAPASAVPPAAPAASAAPAYLAPPAATPETLRPPWLIAPLPAMRVLAPLCRHFAVLAAHPKGGAAGEAGAAGAVGGAVTLATPLAGGETVARTLDSIADAVREGADTFRERGVPPAIIELAERAVRAAPAQAGHVRVAPAQAGPVRAAPAQTGPVREGRPGGLVLVDVEELWQLSIDLEEVGLACGRERAASRQADRHWFERLGIAMGVASSRLAPLADARGIVAIGPAPR